MASKLDKSMIVAGAGLVASIFTTLVKKVREQGGTDEDIHYLATSDGEKILVKFAELIVGVKRQIFKVIVDYTKSLEEMIKAGQYDWVNDDITSDHFPIKGSGQKEMEIRLFHFNRPISSDDAIAEMAKEGFRSVDPPENLALGAEHPELQKQFPIVALGSPWRGPYGDRFVLCLDWDGDERALLLRLFEDDWDEDYRFAAVHK